MISRRIFFGIVALGTFFMLAGCQRTPRLEQKVSAESARDFSSWQTRTRDGFTPEEWAEFEAALQDIKLKIVALQEASGAGAVNDALRPKIHGRTVREVLRFGYEERLWRLNVQRTELEKMVQGNATLRTPPGDTESASYLQRKQQDQRAQLDKTLAEIRFAESRREALATPVEKK